MKLIEQIVKENLERWLEVPVYTELPAAPPENCVVIERTGGGWENRISAAVFAVQAYGASLYDAAVLNEEVKAAMDKLAKRGEIARCALNSDYNFTDPETKRYRYQSLWDISYY